MQFLGRYTDLVATIGATIALIIGGYQLLGFFEGAETILLKPRQITLVAYQYPNSEKEYVRISARMAYANDGQPGYNSIIIEEKVEFTLNGQVYEQVGQSYETFRYDSGRLISNFVSDAKPLPVNASSSESHETFFAPYPVPCPKNELACKTDRNFLEWTEFVTLVDQSSKIEFTLVGVLHDEDPVEAMCIIEFDEQMLLGLILRKHAAPACTNTND